MDYILSQSGPHPFVKALVHAYKEAPASDRFLIDRDWAHIWRAYGRSYAANAERGNCKECDGLGFIGESTDGYECPRCNGTRSDPGEPRDEDETDTEEPA
jgi:hypothetical protein